MSAREAHPVVAGEPDGPPGPVPLPMQAQAQEQEQVPPEHPAVARLAQGGTLGAQVRRGVAWSAATNLLLLVVQLGGSAALGRLLLPEAFGLVALGLVVTRLASLLSGLGLSTSIVQTRHVTERLLSTAFWASLLIGIGVTAVLAALAPLVALLYGEPQLTGLLQVSALTFALGIAVVPMALLQRTLQFKKVAWFEVIASTVNMGVSIALAVAGAGAYSLVAGGVAHVLVIDVLAFTAVRWVPRAGLHRAEMGQLWRFGRSLTGANLLYFASRNADTALLGFAVGAGQVGLYNRAYNIMLMPLTQVTNVLTRVLLPAYAQLQDDQERLRRAWVATVRTSLVFGLPVGLGVGASAPAVLETLYGPRWLDATTTLVLLSASLAPQLIARNFSSLYQALGATRLILRVALQRSLLTIAGTAVGLLGGIEGVAAALLVTSCLTLFVGLVPLMRLIGLRAGELWRAVRGLLLAGTVMALAAYGVGEAVGDLPAPAVLAVQAAAGAVVYAAMLALVDRETVRAGLALVRRRR